MLRKITIKKLYNLYDYNIDMGLNNGPIHFITAPNGYGKTTILEMVNAILTSHYDDLLRIPFETVSLYFDDALELRVDQKQHFEDVDITLDVQEKPTIELVVRLLNHKTEKAETLGEIYVPSEPNHLMQVDDRGNIEMFLVSKTCHYLTDSRLLRKKTDMALAEQEMDSISLNIYAERLKQILNDPQLYAANISRIDTFKKIVDRSDFSSKYLEINKLFGFRFVAKDELSTKISLNSLSSGEKHLLIQGFELLFNAQQGTLVLIDEPELSFHMMWQVNYLKMIQEIAQVRGFQYLIATHSPHIFNNMWSLTTDLYTNSLGNE